VFSLSSFKEFCRALFLSALCVSYTLSLFLRFNLIVLNDKERRTEESSTVVTLQTSVNAVLVRVSSLTTQEMLRGLSQSMQTNTRIASRRWHGYLFPYASLSSVISDLLLTNTSFNKQPTQALLFHTLYPRVGAKT
jgi:hypothetical protein